MSRATNSAKAETWRGRLQRYQRSGLTITDFCNRERVTEATFHYWRRRLANQRLTVDAHQQQNRVEKPSFLPVRVSLAMIEIHLPGGARVLIPSGETHALRIALEAAAQCGDISPERTR